MYFLEQFHFKALKHELINKFCYTSTKELPQLKKVIIHFSCKTTDFKLLITSLIALQLITEQKGILIRTKKSNISLKIRKGNPIGCKVTLRKTKMFYFLSKIVVEILPVINNSESVTFNRKVLKNSFSYQIHDTFIFSELENYYYLFFNNLPRLNVTLVIDSNIEKEIFFILQRFQFPLNKFSYMQV